MEWIEKKSKVKPPMARPILCHCPGWNDTGYQIAHYSGSEFYYDEQPNDMFHDEVIAWALFLEAD